MCKTFHLQVLGRSLILSSQFESTNCQIPQSSSHPHRTLRTPGAHITLYSLSPQNLPGLAPNPFLKLLRDTGSRGPRLSEHQWPLAGLTPFLTPWCAWGPGPTWWWTCHTQEPGLEWGDLNDRLELWQGSTVGPGDRTWSLDHCHLWGHVWATGLASRRLVDIRCHYCRFTDGPSWDTPFRRYSKGRR